MESKELLKKLTGKKNIYLVSRCNEAIKQSLKILDKPLTLIQNEGGWLTYRQYPKKTIELKTQNGFINLDDLEEKANQDSVLLTHSSPGYLGNDSMEKIFKVCKSKKCLVINDCCGSIGTDAAKIGDIIVGSFGKWKPIWLGHGGFIASDGKLDVEENFDFSKEKELIVNLKNLDSRLEKIHEECNKIKKDLSSFDIIKKDSKGLVVIVKFRNDKERSEIVKYCEANSLEYTECPRYIRSNEKAISIEVKRLRWQ